jgi:phosphoenolpyruvate-protein kinase (PTS system EI component)
MITLNSVRTIMPPAMSRKLGEGIAVFDIEESVEGEIHHVTTPQEVIELTKEDLSDVIGLVRAGTSAFASPLLANDVHGLITMEGAPSSHLGIVSREYDIPCIMSLEPEDGLVDATTGSDEFFEEWGILLDGQTISMESVNEGAGNPRGEVYEG